MFKNIIGTVFTKILVAVMTLVIIVISSKNLGAEGVGHISLILLAISIYVLLNQFTSGALVYFVPRADNFQLLVIAYAGIIFTALPFTILYYSLSLAADEFFVHVLFLSLIFSVSGVNQSILIGKQKILVSNSISLLQIGLTFVSLVVFFYILKQLTVYSYIYALYIGYSTGFAAGFFKIKNDIVVSSLKGIRVTFKQIVGIASFSAFGNLIQKINYRLSYYLIEHFIGLKALGRFSVGTQISESVLLIGRSVALVQYAKISNTDDKRESGLLTLRFAKAIVVLTGFMITCFALIPADFYGYIFGKDFHNINLTIFSLAPGVTALSGSIIFSHYFSGLGKENVNAAAAFIGLILMVVLGIILIPKLDLLGAGIAMSASYTGSAIFQFLMFIKSSGTRLVDFLFTKADYLFYKQLILQKIKLVKNSK